ncbi:MAG: hypothetical protein WAU36_10965 [Cyclobacteriaceae bacterium]
MLKPESSSFRDPSGYLVIHENVYYRVINKVYASQIELLESSGLLAKLFEHNWLVGHERVNNLESLLPDAYAILKPKQIPIITYPYEWCFGQLKDAALLTLRIQSLALQYEMILKDASAFNVQFFGHRPVFIDTLSFEKYVDGQPWQAYKQFCEHFLAPLCLCAYSGSHYMSLLKLNLDGIRLNLASEILPFQTWFRPSVLLHLHLHSRTIKKFESNSGGKKTNTRIKKENLIALTDHLINFVEGLQLRKGERTTWKDYDKQIHYSDNSRKNKGDIVKDYVGKVDPTVIWDIGGNDGFFSRLVSEPHRLILSLDADILAIEKNYGLNKQLKEDRVMPLCFDMANPTSNLGWAGTERTELPKRSKPEMIMALAVIHHITITHNIPFKMVAAYFADLAEWIIIEWVPADDEKISPLADTSGKSLYNRKNFEQAFFTYFDCIHEEGISELERTILLLKRK